VVQGCDGEAELVAREHAEYPGRCQELLVEFNTTRVETKVLVSASIVV
jgi:hypothetical protein